MRIQLRARRLALAVGLDRARLARAPVPVDRRRWRDTKTRRGPPCRQTPVTASGYRIMEWDAWESPSIHNSVKPL